MLFGILAGAIGGLLLRYVKRHNLAEQVWLPAVPVGIAAISYGLATPPGGSGFIAAFVAGLTYGTLRRRTRTSRSRRSSVGSRAPPPSSSSERPWWDLC